MKKIEITWLDSESECGWQNYDEAEKYAKRSIIECKTIGYLFYEDKKIIAVVQSYNPDNVADIMRIPKFAIKKRKYL